jgi:hypothetical protein
MVHHGTKIIAAIALLTFMIAAGGFFGFRYLIMVNEERLTNERIAFEESIQQKEALTTLTALLGETEADRGALADLVLTEDRIIDFLSLIEGLADQTGTEIQTSGLAEVAVDERFAALTIGISAKGSFGAVMQVLKLLENLPYHTHVTGVKLIGGGGETDIWTLTVQLLVSKYVTI